MLNIIYFIIIPFHDVLIPFFFFLQIQLWSYWFYNTKVFFRAHISERMVTLKNVVTLYAFRMQIVFSRNVFRFPQQFPYA